MFDRAAMNTAMLKHKDTRGVLPDALLLLRRYIFFSLLNLLAVASLFAGTTGILRGRVLDKESNRALPGVNVTLVGTTLGTITDAEGSFQINDIRAGLYSVQLSLLGYKKTVFEKVAIIPDLRTQLDVSLEPSPIELQAVEITYQRPLIQKDQAATAYSIGEIKLEKLPVTAFRDVLSLQPGTTIEGNVRGGKSNEVVFLVDGLPVQDVIGGGLGTELPKSSITGMTIYTGGYEAEYGNALSGVVNVVTKTGTDRQTLGVRLERDSWLPQSVNKQQDRASELEISASGPLVEDKLSYFTANTFTLSDTRWWQDLQYYFYSPMMEEASGFGKVEYITSSTTRLSAQGIYSHRKWHDYEFSWRFNLGGLPIRERNSYRAALMFTNTLSDKTSLTASLSTFYNRSRIGNPIGADVELVPYEYDFYLRYVLTGQRYWWADTRQHVYTLKADLNSQIGRFHLLKGGFEFNQYVISSDLLKFEPQTTYFGKPVVDAPLLNYSNTYRYWPRSGSVYLQDKLELEKDGSNLSVGVRWDFLDPTAERPVVEFVPTNPNEYQERIVGSTKARFKHQFSPRVGFSSPLTPDVFFFANVGRYFQYPLFNYLYSGINPAQLRTGTRNVLTGNPDLEPERTLAWEIGIKHSIGDNYVGSVTFFKKEFQNQIDTKTLIPFDSKAGGDYGFASYVNNAAANATGLELVLSRERDEDLSGSISYSYMITEGVSEYADQTINYAQWGFPLAHQTFPLSWDQRHTVKVDVEARIVWGVTANVIVMYNSPRPYTYYPTRDGFTPADSSLAFLPNNERMQENLFVNLKISRQIELSSTNHTALSLYADIRNLLNRSNVRWVDSNGRIGGELEDPGAYYDLRRVKVGAKIEF